MIVVAWGNEFQYIKGGGKGHSYMPGLIHRRFQSKEANEGVVGHGAGATSGDAVVVQMDVRGIWANDPNGSHSDLEMMRTAECLRCVNMGIAMIQDWFAHCDGKVFVLSLSCPLD